ncbi:MAG: hypothetical protein Q8880_01135 [Bacteroidota bacterium]|nr:hypothetical protein [Bacteroidota bacterium]
MKLGNVKGFYGVYDIFHINLKVLKKNDVSLYSNTNKVGHGF